VDDKMNAKQCAGCAWIHWVVWRAGQ